MQVVTVATHSERYFPCLQESCHRHGYTLVVLGWRQRWQGYAWKFKLVMDYLRTLPPRTIVVYVDAFDVIMLQAAAEVQVRFEACKTNVLFSAEMNMPNCIMDYLYRRMFPFKGPSLNSGLYMGYAVALVEVLEQMQGPPNSDDQYLLALLTQRMPVPYDKHNSIFLNIHGTSTWRCATREHFDLRTSQYCRLVNGHIVLPNGARSCIVQGPGNVNMDSIAIALGYTVPTQMRATSCKYTIVRAAHALPYYLREILALILLCVFLYIYI